MIIPVELLFYYFSNVVCVEILICRKQKGCLQLLLENAWLYTCLYLDKAKQNKRSGSQTTPPPFKRAGDADEF